MYEPEMCCITVTRGDAVASASVTLDALKDEAMIGRVVTARLLPHLVSDEELADA